MVNLHYWEYIGINIIDFNRKQHFFLGRGYRGLILLLHQSFRAVLYHLQKFTKFIVVTSHMKLFLQHLN